MHILVSVDDGYLMPLLVMLTSLCATNDPRQLTVWLLYTGLSEAARAQVAQLVEGSGATLEQVHVDDACFAGYPTAPYITRETYLRLLSGEVLPAELDRVLWLDADLVVAGSLRELYECNVADNALVACAYGDEVPRDIAGQCAALGLDPATYVNAGVMLINLDAWRACDLRAQMTVVMARGVPLKYADQDLVNAIFAGRIGLADANTYNFKINRDLDVAACAAAREHARIIHYCGKMKPWMFSDLPLGEVWRSYYQQSPCAARPLRLISRVGLSRLAGRAKGRADR